jgi:hypothetical protein
MQGCHYTQWLSTYLQRHPTAPFTVVARRWAAGQRILCCFGAPNYSAVTKIICTNLLHTLYTLPEDSHYYYYYYYTWMSLLTGLFVLVLLLNQRWSPPLKLQASHCSTFSIICDVLSISVFCSESIERFPGISSKFFLKLLVTIPVAPIITGTIVHFRFHIRYISVPRHLYFNFFSASFCTTFLSAGIATSSFYF